MTIGKSSKKNRVPRSPSFLDRTNGFYGRLDEIGGDDVRMEGETTEEQMGTVTGEKKSSSQDNMMAPAWAEEDDQVVDYNHGMIDDDGTTLLKRKPSRLSRRWSRRSSKKLKYDRFSSEKESRSEGTETTIPTSVDLNVEVTQEPKLVHFSLREHADDQVLISGKGEGEKELEDTTKEKETESKLEDESMKVVKRNTIKNYRKAVDRAFRRGWETFVANMYTLTLTPVSSTSSSSPSDKTGMNRNQVLAELR